MTLPGSIFRPHWILLVAAGLLLLIAPGASKEFTSPEEILVSSSFLPVVVHISTPAETRSWTMGPFQDIETGMHGPANVTIAPALPGTSLLIVHGSTAAFVPLATFTSIMALLFRIIEPRSRRNGHRPPALPGAGRPSKDQETEKTERKNDSEHEPEPDTGWTRTGLQARRNADNEAP